MKVFLGLMLIILSAFVSSGITGRYFNRSSIMFQGISQEQLPLLISASKLAKEVEGLISDGAELVLTENPLLLEELSKSISMDLARIQSIISELSDFDELSNFKSQKMNDARYLSKRSRQIFDHLQALVKLIRNNIDIEQRILQISIHIRRTSESIFLSRKAQKDAYQGYIEEMFIQAFSLLRDVPNISNNQRLEEYQSQILELKKRIGAALKVHHIEDSPLIGYFTIMERYGTGDKGLLALAAIHLRQKNSIQDKLTEITFLSDGLVSQTEQIFSMISAAIQQQSHKFAEETKIVESLILVIPFAITVSSVLIFLFIRRSVIGRILVLEQTMKAHVKGNRLPVPVEGGDEITSMARSLSYFVEKRNEYETTLHEARLAAERASQAKTIFLANMTHELRTPLNAILGFSRLLTKKLTKNKILSLHEMNYLDSICRSGEHLLSLINQVLDLSTIEAGRVVLNESKVDLHFLLEEVEYMFQIRAASKKIVLLFEYGENIPHFIIADPVKLRQVLINLLSNAFKFTEKRRHNRPRGSGKIQW